MRSMFGLFGKSCNFTRVAVASEAPVSSREPLPPPTTIVPTTEVSAELGAVLFFNDETIPVVPAGTAASSARCLLFL